MVDGFLAISTGIRTAQLDRIGKRRPVLGMLLAAELFFSRTKRGLFRSLRRFIPSTQIK